ncbi:MAG: pyridoxine 5'-phosphate synthase [Bacteroidetes bacterium]|nr:pyridoxine 5'-phosphate synthase [Bacteroidota bacterium]MDA0903445.1 pyridoxine 5'-phosphate synthase [Bacteroidota bacterium]MDA1241523.1 pyridoxine 5'-phosphate synthase [Bacteroidota bacterium]
MTRLSVNVNKIATLRNARGGDEPNVVRSAVRIQGFGADGITVHPRPDARHITYQDVRDLKEVVHTEFNVEGYPTADFIDLVCDVQPDQVTLVPDAPEVLTSQAGWKVTHHRDWLADILKTFTDRGIRTSLFIETDRAQIEAAAHVGAHRIELYTEPYAQSYVRLGAGAAHPFAEAALWAHEAGLGVNAGHDLNLQNLRDFAMNVPHLQEVSIGHALISDALELGMANAVAQYKGCLIPWD